jgi:hypothetical protein
MLRLGLVGQGSKAGGGRSHRTADRTRAKRGALMFLFDLPRHTGIVVFVVLLGSYWLWRWIRFDESEHPPDASDRNKEQ